MKTVYRHSIDGKLSPFWGEQLRSGINNRGPLRVQEETNSARVVGVDNVEFLDHQDGVIEGGLPLRRDIALAIRRHRPDVVITMSYEDGPRGPASADHSSVGLAVVDATRDAGNRWVFSEQLSRGIEPWNGTGNAG